MISMIQDSANVGQTKMNVQLILIGWYQIVESHVTDV